MKSTRFFTLILLGNLVLSGVFADQHGGKLYSGEPIKALLITGGCCHNYHFQSGALTKAVSKKADVNWTIYHQGGTGNDYKAAYYDDPNWAKPYDIVIHNECFAKVTDTDYVRKITKAHKQGVAAMVIHCAMHTYREIEADDWRKFLGVTSRRHERKTTHKVKNAATNHPAVKGFPENWTTPIDELYVVEKLWPNAKALATTVSEKDGKEHPVIWVNDFEGARVFGTTYGHSDETFSDPVFLNLLAHGFVWAVGK